MVICNAIFLTIKTKVTFHRSQRQGAGGIPPPPPQCLVWPPHSEVNKSPTLGVADTWPWAGPPSLSFPAALFVSVVATTAAKS